MNEQMPDLTIREYVERLAGDEATPGGGSAAALAAALAAASARMVGSFTVGREKFADVEEQMREHLQAIDRLSARMLQLVQEDVAAYGAVRDAYALPKDSDEQAQARADAIQRALKDAARVPLRLAEACAELAEHLGPLHERGNQNLVSDVGVAAKLCEAASECAWLNVEVNLSFIEDEAFITTTRAKLQGWLGEVRGACDEAWWRVSAKVTG